MNDLTQKILDNLEELPEAMQSETLNFIQFLKNKLNRSKEAPLESCEPNGQAIAKIFERIAARQSLQHIKDPSSWQREARKDRPLPGRDI
jgi:hypothetical protein